MKRTLVFVTLLTALLGTLSATAQVSDTDYLQQLRTDIQADRQALVAASLGLTEEEGEAFWPVYREYRSDMAKVGDRLQTLIQDYAQIWDTATEEQAKTMVNQMLAIQRDELKVRKSHLSKFRRVLPEVKVARFLQIENKIDVIVKLGLADVIPLIEAAE